MSINYGAKLQAKNAANKKQKTAPRGKICAANNTNDENYPQSTLSHPRKKSITYRFFLIKSKNFIPYYFKILEEAKRHFPLVFLNFSENYLKNFETSAILYKKLDF